MVVVVYVHTKKREILGDGVFSKTETFLSHNHKGQRLKDWHCLLSFPAAKPDEKSGGHDHTVTDTAKGFSAASYVLTTPAPDFRILTPDHPSPESLL